MEKLRRYFLELQSTLPPDGPGFSAVVVQHDAVACELHHGMASLEWQVPLSGKSAWYLASESKQFTAACVLALVRAWHRQWADRDSLLHAMLQPSPLADGTLPAYRFGLEMIEYNGADVVFHSGGLWGFNTLPMRLPARRPSAAHRRTGSASCQHSKPCCSRYCLTTFAGMVVNRAQTV